MSGAERSEGMNMKMILFCLAAWLCSLALLPAGAQQAVWTVPLPATTSGGNASTTIAVTNTFQLVFASTTVAPGSPTSGVSSRHGCTIINQGTNTMWVTEGIGAAGSTKAKAVVLAPSASFYCNWNGVVLVGEIDITGTAGDGFYATQE